MASYTHPYKHLTFLPEIFFNPPERHFEINPDYRPSSAIRFISAVPTPGLTVHPDLHAFPFIWEICPVEISYRKHYAILPGVMTVTLERATGWHICHLGNDKKDGWYYLEHYLAMEERRVLELPARESGDWGRNTAYVVTVRPAFDWAEYYRLSPPGYRQYGLYYTMGSGLGPIYALNGVHKQPSLPGINFNYKPDSPEHRMGHGFFVADNEARPDYAELAWDSQHLLHLWQDWVGEHYGIVSAARGHPEQAVFLFHHAKQGKKVALSRYHHSQATALSISRENKRRLQRQGPAAQPMATGQVPIDFRYLWDPRPPRLPPPLMIGGNMHQIPNPQVHQVPYPQNQHYVHPNATLHIDLNYRQGGHAPAGLEQPQFVRAQQAVFNDPSILRMGSFRPVSTANAETSQAGSSTAPVVQEPVRSEKPPQ